MRERNHNSKCSEYGHGITLFAAASWNGFPRAVGFAPKNNKQQQRREKNLLLLLSQTVSNENDFQIYLFIYFSHCLLWTLTLTKLVQTRNNRRLKFSAF
jgi:hypothetical protein